MPLSELNSFQFQATQNQITDMLLKWNKRKESFLVEIMQPRVPMTAEVLMKMDDGLYQLGPMIADE